MATLVAGSLWVGKAGRTLQEALGRKSLTQTAPLRRTAPGGRRLALIHTWTCSAVQKEPGKSAGPGDMQQFSKAGGLPLYMSPCFSDGPQRLLPFCQDSGQDTSTSQRPLHWSPEVLSCTVLSEFCKFSPWGEVWSDKTPNDNWLFLG